MLSLQVRKPQLCYSCPLIVTLYICISPMESVLGGNSAIPQFLPISVVKYPAQDRQFFNLLPGSLQFNYGQNN